PKTDASQVGCGIIQVHAVVFGCHPRATTRSKLTLGSKAVRYYRRLYRICHAPSANRQFFKTEETWNCKQQRPRWTRAPALACQQIRGKDVDMIAKRTLWLDLIAVTAALTMENTQISAENPRGTATSPTTAKGYDHPDQFMHLKDVKPAENMYPIIAHAEQEKQARDKLGALERRIGKKPNI